LGHIGIGRVRGDRGTSGKEINKIEDNCKREVGISNQRRDVRINASSEVAVSSDIRANRTSEVAVSSHERDRDS
jgi:hypothetical protein